jgi:glutaminyl-peptide cyclotransferase
MKVLAIVLLTLISLQTLAYIPAQTAYSPEFDGDAAYSFLVDQCDFGTRPPGSENLTLCRAYISDGFRDAGWDVVLQNFTYLGVECFNIIATWNDSEPAPIILGAHYDTRPRADQDPDPVKAALPVMGANDAASGVAILLELALSLPETLRPLVELVCFDAEDSGGINGWSWIQGSTYYVGQLDSYRLDNTSAMVLLDMVGDASLRLPKERSSTKSLQNQVWSIAASLGYESTFLDEDGSSITDDHSPFLSAGIPALDIIHTPFPWYWHTSEDTPDKCSAESLDIVGDVVEAFIASFSAGTDTFTTDPSLDVTIIALVAAPFLLITMAYLYNKKR